ncbi:type IV toxin-antitoxin system AbiEi family antitoxin [Curtobacterium caseinilyticum]|uniref:Type IV toxin-antitoxin system AbiEi family antitoxin n=1 Tax=Curtobacterium caseinilyticum TaxID=3055137 RepID=A0ABT7TKT9_9MICO|nr:type IV toxin-antitoxin system AbiEi family antitoxin [Curtobacterium caseinilyticum]MDM7890198.1 type IV toxin-antitoxin system AbiEi family antitoxin [Curtobacterium caseinilyticum]
MPSPHLLTSDDWPEAELRAAVLAGELVPVGQCWASPAEPQLPALRAAAHAWGLPDRRLVASGRSAAWIWGGTSRPPAVSEVSIPPTIRVRVDADVRLREVRLDPSDVVDLDGVRVTTPLRTAVDLLRAPGTSEPGAITALQGLLGAGVVSAGDVRARLDALGTIPMARQAARRFDRVTTLNPR